MHDDVHLVLHILMDSMLHECRHNLFVGGLRWHVFQNQSFNLSSIVKRYLLCIIIDVICWHITRHNLTSCIGYDAPQKVLCCAGADYFLLGIK